MEILVNVANQKLKIATNLKTLVEGTQEFIFFRFNLSNDWDGLKPFAQFTQNGNSYNQYLDDDNCVALPAEIVSGTCTMMLYGSKGTKRATTNYLTLIIDKNILVQDAQSTEISQSLYDQLVSQIDTVPTLIKEAEKATKDANAAAVEANKATERANDVISAAEGEHIIPDFAMSDTSENAVQNRVISAALSEIKQSVNSDCANALKKTVPVSGETVIEDVAPNSPLNIHEAQAGQTVTVRGKNLLKAIPERARNNIVITDNTITTTASVRHTLLNEQELKALNLKPGATVTTSAEILGENISGTTGQVAIPSKVSGIPHITLKSGESFRVVTLPDDYNPENYVGLCLYGVCTYKNLQIEYGTKATEYEQGFADVTVTADANGKATAENIAYPTAIIEMDGACTVEYNRDADQVIENIEKSVPTDVTMTDTLLQLTANGVPVGDGVHIDREIRATLLFDKLNGVEVEGSHVLTAPVVGGVINSSTWGYVTIETKLLHSVNHTDGGTLTVVPVLSGMPTILYDSDASGNIQNRHFSDAETVSVRFFAQMDGEDFILDETLLKQVCDESGGVFSASADIYPADSTKNILTYTIKLEFNGDNAAATVQELRTTLRDVLAVVYQLQISTQKQIVTEMESEVIYNA